MENKEIKEPIRKKWIWIALALILIGNVPWYLPVGTYEPMIFGVPYWALIILAFSLILCGFLSWVALKQWNIVEDEEEAEKRGRINE